MAADRRTALVLAGAVFLATAITPVGPARADLPETFDGRVTSFAGEGLVGVATENTLQLSVALSGVTGSIRVAIPGSVQDPPAPGQPPGPKRDLCFNFAASDFHDVRVAPDPANAGGFTMRGTVAVVTTVADARCPGSSGRATTDPGLLHASVTADKRLQGTIELQGEVMAFEGKSSTASVGGAAGPLSDIGILLDDQDRELVLSKSDCPASRRRAAPRAQDCVDVEVTASIFVEDAFPADPAILDTLVEVVLLVSMSKLQDTSEPVMKTLAALEPVILRLAINAKAPGEEGQRARNAMESLVEYAIAADLCSLRGGKCDGLATEGPR